MAKVIGDISISVDGSVSGPDQGLGQGRAVAEERDVIMDGAAVIRGALEQNLLDELRLHPAPVLPGAGTPLFAGGPPRSLRQAHVRATAHATHLTYRMD